MRGCETALRESTACLPFGPVSFPKRHFNDNSSQTEMRRAGFVIAYRRLLPHLARKARHRDLLVIHYDQDVEKRRLIIRQIPVQADIGTTILKLRWTFHPNYSDLAKRPAIVFIRFKFRPAAKPFVQLIAVT